MLYYITLYHLILYFGISYYIYIIYILYLLTHHIIWSFLNIILHCVAIYQIYYIKPHYIILFPFYKRYCTHINIHIHIYIYIHSCYIKL